MSDVDPRRCDGCKHWNAKPNPRLNHDVISGLGWCLLAVPYWEATEWAKDDTDPLPKRALLPEYKDQRIFAQDGSDYRADVITRADFYCADHAPEEAETT